MNKPIARLFWVALLMFAGLVGATSWWTIVRADALDHDYSSENRRDVLRGLKVRRGAIRAADGTVLARSVRASDGTYSRRYPAGGLFAQALGYSYTSLGQAGLEASYNDDLTGKRGDASSLLNEVLGRSNQGDRLQTSLDPEAQRAALAGLAGRKGAVVALDPRTGAVEVMASVPGYDPGGFRRAGAFSRLSTDGAAPLLNRATQGLYPPGSTFKVVTAIAGIDSGAVTPDSVLSGKSPITVSGVPLANDDGEQFGDITFTKALTLSVNTVFAQVAEKVGKQTMKTYMERLGFDRDLPLDEPDDQITPSGLHSQKTGRIISPTGGVDIGRVGIGQERLLVSPLQMAQVAAAVANGGRLMKPHLVSKVLDADGRTVRTIDPALQSRVMSPQTAQEVGAMMGKVVQEGTGTAAALSGVSVAGKTGTAQKGEPGSNLTQPWFIAYAPADDPRVAVAATVETTQGGFGGTVAAPIAKSVIQALLGSRAGG